MKPYFEIKPDIKNTIINLVDKCKELQLGNCSFQLYDEANTQFHMTEYKNYWEVNVTSEPGRNKRYSDIYRLTDGSLIYQWTE